MSLDLSVYQGTVDKEENLYHLRHPGYGQSVRGLCSIMNGKLIQNIEMNRLGSAKCANFPEIVLIHHTSHSMLRAEIGIAPKIAVAPKNFATGTV